ncbi:MAG: SBBP repeat-containing protein, partial [Candidatus Thermoplasmatota archaeon]|nr:SBBP repeat-containing protein [Candidatus Thermoplasmatota archaeon]
TDAFVSKMDLDLSSLHYSTYIGGSSSDYGRGIDIDGSGNAYITGSTYSSNFPVTSGANDTVFNGSEDAFVAKVDSSGSSLLYSTYYGGDSYDEAWDIRVDSSSNMFIVGNTMSTDLYTSSNAFDRTHNGLEDVFVAKILSSGSSLGYSTYLGGYSYDYAYCMGLDWNGNVYLTGATQSSDYPTTFGSYSTSMSGNQDVIVTKLNPGGTSLFFSTFVGGSISQQGHSIVIDGSGNSYVTGSTSSLDFPATKGCNQSTSGGGYDAFVFKLGSGGASLLYSTFFGGSSSDYGEGIDVDDKGNVVITGYTRSSDLYTSRKAYDGTMNGYQTAFLSKLDSAGANMVYSSYIGGTGYEEGYCTAFLSNGEAMMCGSSNSNPYPTTSGVYSRSHGGGDDGVLSVFNFTTRPDPPTGLTAVFTYGSVELNWTEPEDDGGMPLQFYRLYRGAEGSQLVFYQEVDGLTYTDTNITDGLGYKYTVRSVNTRGESTDSNLVRAIDEELPVLEEDRTETNATTGDPFFFNVSVSDNIHIKEVMVTYRYGFGDIFQGVLTGEDGEMLLRIKVKDDLDPIRYQFSVIDDFNNGIMTGWKNVTVSDNDLPVFLGEDTDPEGTTGDRHEFRTKLEDNMGVSSVTLHYHYGEEEMIQVPLKRGNNGWWNVKIDVLNDTTKDIAYMFTALDSSGNLNDTPENIVQISDDDPINFTDDLSQVEATTGDEFIFMVNASDNIAIDSVFVEYWFGEGEMNSLEMEGLDTFEAEIELLWNSTEQLKYRFKGIDTAGNIIRSEPREIEVIDNDLPDIEDLTGSSAGTGEKFIFRAVLDDNIGIYGAKIVYHFGEGSDKERLLIERDEEYIAELQIPREKLLDLVYHIEAMDAQGNRRKTDDSAILISDVIPPTVSKMVNITIYEGKLLTTKLETSDNIEVASMEYSGSPIEPFFVDENKSVVQIKGYVREDGVFDIEITIFDTAGNERSTFFTLTVIPEDNDSDGDLIPDLVELEAGLDMNDPADADRDEDGDGLSNLVEFQKGTNITKTDSDSDGMDDAWEVKYGLDPVNKSGMLDTDGDGLTDLEEYQKGSDPTRKEDEGIPLALIIVIAFVILLVLAIIVFALMRKGKKKEPVKEKEPPIYVPPPEEVFGLPVPQTGFLPAPQTGELPQPVAVGEFPQPYPVQEGFPPAQYDQYGQSIQQEIQYDEYGQPVQYDENGQLIQYDRSIQYYGSGQQMTNEGGILPVQQEMVSDQYPLQEEVPVEQVPQDGAVPEPSSEVESAPVPEDVPEEPAASEEPDGVQEDQSERTAPASQ